MLWVQKHPIFQPMVASKIKISAPHICSLFSRRKRAKEREKREARARQDGESLCLRDTGWRSRGRLRCTRVRPAWNFPWRSLYHLRGIRQSPLSSLLLPIWFLFLLPQLFDAWNFSTLISFLFVFNLLDGGRTNKIGVFLCCLEFGKLNCLKIQWWFIAAWLPSLLSIPARWPDKSPNLRRIRWNGEKIKLM